MTSRYATLIFLALSYCAGAGAQPGTLDSTFGTDGVVLTNIQGPDVAQAVIVQPDGRIIVAGESYRQGPTGLIGGFAVARYLPDGSLDGSFGTAGTVVTEIEGAESFARDAVLLPDGRLLVVGGVLPHGGHHLFAAARYQPDGLLDSTFSEDGVATTDFGARGWAYGVTVQADGAVVAAGFAEIGGEARFALARYMPDGSLDPSFGGGGLVTDTPAPASARAVALLPDGRIYACGSNGGQALIVRYLPDGTLDASFDGDGRVSRGIPKEAYDIATYDDGSILVVGQVGSAWFGLARMNEDGSLRESFGSGGTRVFDPVPSQVSQRDTAVEIQPDGKILLSGTHRRSIAEGYRGIVARFSESGSLDQTFGTGYVGTQVAGGNQMTATALQADGRLLVAGQAASDFALVRYNTGVVTAAEPTAPTARPEMTIAPNPVRAEARIRIAVSEPLWARVSIVDVLGREVATLREGLLDRGVHELRFETGGLPAGVYLASLVGANLHMARRLIVAR